MGNPNLKNRVIPNSAVDKELYEWLRNYSKKVKYLYQNYLIKLSNYLKSLLKNSRLFYLIFRVGKYFYF